jgi:hypothetical protein
LGSPIGPLKGNQLKAIAECSISPGCFYWWGLIGCGYIFLNDYLTNRSAPLDRREEGEKFEVNLIFNGFLAQNG